MVKPILSTVGRGGKRPGAGRPELHPDDRLAVPLGLRVRPDQATRYREAADAEKMDVLDWARKHLDAAADKALKRQ